MKSKVVLGKQVQAGFSKDLYDFRVGELFVEDGLQEVFRVESIVFDEELKAHIVNARDLTYDRIVPFFYQSPAYAPKLYTVSYLN